MSEDNVSKLADLTDGSSSPAQVRTVDGFRLVLDRMFDPTTHVWVKPTADGRLRVGMDALGVETSGTLVQLSLLQPGSRVSRGAAIGQLEAAKFVGPLSSPISGTVTAVNDAVLADPGLVEADPYGAGWLVELAPDDPGAARDHLLFEPDEVVGWFTTAVADYRAKGLVAQ